MSDASAVKKSGVTDKQWNHGNQISNKAQYLIFNKYIKGAKEHGTYLPEIPVEELLDNAIEEAIDQVVYLLTLKENL